MNYLNPKEGKIQNNNFKKNLIELYKKLGVNKNEDLNLKSSEISLLFDKQIGNNYSSEKYSIRKKDNNIRKAQRLNLRLTYDEIKKQAYKVVFTLQNYIIYLSYRSNGTPKKLTALTEQLMREGPTLDNNNKSNYKFLRDNIVVLHDRGEDPLTTDLSDKLFLKFGFDTQYEIGLTSNLYRPYIIANSRHLKSLGDKLLFSSSFIIDHILKFHPFGFSWRNLELIPEVVLVNREPNLRKYIEDLMQFYSLTYVRDTVSGIFDYRFRSVIRRELVYLSKTSDLSSAAFNFTLDESLSTKRLYKKKLLEMGRKYQQYSPTKGDNQFVHSLSFLQTILGNLHFYDKEYDEAILYYTESIQSLRLPNAVGSRYITRHQFLLWLRNQLKLGLTLEKIRAFDSAFSLYRTLIIDSGRYLKMVISKTSSTLVESKDHRTIQLISMPFVAFLAATEKARYDGITYANLYRSREEFNKIVTPAAGHFNIDLKKQDKYRRDFLQADYYNNVGSILFYKNCQFSNFFNSKKGKDKLIWWLESFEEFEKDKEASEKGKNIIAEQQEIIYNKETPGREYDFFPSLSPFNYYWNSLYFLTKYHRDRVIEQILIVEPTERLVDSLPLRQNLLAICTGFLLPACVDMISSNRFNYIAIVVSKIGDSILASLRKENFLIPKEKFDPLDIINPQKIDEKNRPFNIKKFRKIVGASLYQAETVLYIYKLAAALFKRAGQNSNFAYQLKKMLYVIKDLIEINKFNEDFENELKLFWGIKKSDKLEYRQIEKIAEVVFRATTWNNEVSNRPQILKYREILQLDDKTKDRELLYNNINNITDNREVVLIVEGTKMKLSFLNIDNYFKDFNLSKGIISSYGPMNNRYLRMLELKFRSERCYFIIKRIMSADGLLNDELSYEPKPVNEIRKHLKKVIWVDKEDLSFRDIITFLIREALFCLRELIKMIKLYDPGYVIGYSFIAEAHNRMGDWCHAFDNYKDILSERVGEIKDINKLEDEIEKNMDNLKKISAEIKGLERKALRAIKEVDKLNNKTRALNQKLFPLQEGSKAEKQKSNSVSNAKIRKFDKEIKKCNTAKAELELELENLKVLETGAKNNLQLKQAEKGNIEEAIQSLIENKKYIGLQEEFITEIKEILGSESLVYLESKNHYESAIQYYYKVIQIHSDGKAYRDKLHSIYMLEDDYNDNSAHYIIASERLRMNTGNIRKKITELSEKIKESKLYDYPSYLSSDDAVVVKPTDDTFKEYMEYFDTKV